ncbi:MAG: 3-isopropylmalate dehydrogenase [Chloroflexota bacterium]|nr:3-isopropylmalate dehydrogenase [Dehalococcoidia bacterium]MDW8252753.1 3-isopropylmalate dehydrogenase [Chloroflexota bacterium]
MRATIALLPGDGIGPDVVRQAVAALDAIALRFGHTFEYRTALIGGCALDETGNSFPPETERIVLEADAVLLGAVGGPKWDDPKAADRPERGLLALRKALGVFANIRPVKPHPVVREATPLKPHLLEGVDLLVIRELLGGLYFGQPSERRVGAAGREAVDTMFYSEPEIVRILRVGFELARSRKKRLTSVDKANILATSRLWRELASELAADYPDVTLEHVLVDAAAMYLIQRPARFDVIVTENMFGDILTDEASVLAGSMGMMPSASLGDRTEGGIRRGLYEPIHGSAPDIAGQNKANPIATILSAALLLRYSFGLEAEACAIEEAVDRVLAEGARTADLATPGEPVIGTDAMGARIAEAIIRAR